MTARAFTSAGRFSPLGPRGMFNPQLDTWPRVFAVHIEIDVNNLGHQEFPRGGPVQRNNNLLANPGQNSEARIARSSVVCPNFTFNSHRLPLHACKHTTWRERSKRDHAFSWPCAS